MSQLVRQVETKPFGRLGRVQENDRAAVVPERESIYGLVRAVDGKNPGPLRLQESNHVADRGSSKAPEAAERFCGDVRTGLDLCLGDLLDFGNAWNRQLIGSIQPLLQFACTRQ